MPNTSPINSNKKSFEAKNQYYMRKQDDLDYYDKETISRYNTHRMCRNSLKNEVKFISIKNNKIHNDKNICSGYSTVCLRKPLEKQLANMDPSMYTDKVTLSHNDSLSNKALIFLPNKDKPKEIRLSFKKSSTKRKLWVDSKPYTPISRLNSDPTISTKQYVCFTYTGTDVKRLLIFMQLMYKMMQNLLQNFKPYARVTQHGISFILAIDSTKLRRYFNGHKSQNIFQYSPHLYLSSNHCIAQLREEPRKPITNKSDNFKLSIEPNCLKFKISLNIHISISSTIFNTLDKIDSLVKNGKPFVNCECSNSPSLYVRNWHFRSITQGYLLKTILRNSNINTLNVMRNLYFIIITSSTPNVNIEIKLNLRNALFMVHETVLQNTFSPNTLIWTVDHEQILKRSISANANFIDENSSEYSEKTLNGEENLRSSSNDTYVFTSMESKSSISSDYGTLQQDVLSKSGISTYTNEKSVETCFSYHTLSRPNFFNSISIAYDNSKAAGDTDSDNISNNSYSYEDNLDFRNILLHSKEWLHKILAYYKINVNEGIFLDFELDSNLKHITMQYWNEINSPKFYKAVLLCLGQTMMHILFNVII